MMKIKKIIASALACALTAALLCVPVFAEGSDDVYEVTDYDVGAYFTNVSTGEVEFDSYKGYFTGVTASDNGDGTAQLVLSLTTSSVTWADANEMDPDTLAKYGCEWHAQKDYVKFEANDDGTATYTFTLSEYTEGGIEFEFAYYTAFFQHQYTVYLLLGDDDVEAIFSGLNSRSAQVIGTVAEEVSEPEYSVTIPEAIDLGTISKEEDTTQSYDVTVIAAELAGGSVSVTGEDAGTIANGESTIAFSNSFGTQTVSGETDESGTALSGEITVAAEDAADAEAGDYSGTTVFTIGYSAADAETPDEYSCTDFDVVSASSGGSYVSFFESLTAYKQTDGSYNFVLYLPANDAAVWDVTEKYPKDNVTVTIDDEGNETLVFSGIITYEEDGYPFGFRYTLPAFGMDHDYEMLLKITETDAAALGLTN